MAAQSTKRRAVTHDATDFWDAVNRVRERQEETERQLARATTEIEHMRRTVDSMVSEMRVLSATLNNVATELRVVRETKTPSVADTVKEWSGVWTSLIAIGAALLAGISLYVKNDNPSPAPFAYERSIPDTPLANKRNRD